MIHGAAYYPEHRDPAKWEFDLDMMVNAGINAVRVGEFAWKRFEPSSNIYDFSWMDSFIEKAAQRDIKILMCPPLRTAPSWLVEQDPSVLIINSRSEQLEFASRYTFCLNNPLLHNRGLALAETMAAHYAPNKSIIGWHLDNEYGDDPDCHCPHCKEQFQHWLERKYGTIQELNFRWGSIFWGLEFDSFAQVPTPRVTKASLHPAHVQAWRRFMSDCTVELVKLQAAAVRKHSTPEQFITTNNQALWNARTDYYTMAKPLDICGTNYYPPYGENFRDPAFALATSRSFKGKNFQVHELKSGPHTIAGAGANTPAPNELARLTMHTIAHGADAVYYFRWRTCPFGPEQNHGAITAPDGGWTRIYDEVAMVGKKLKTISEQLDNTILKSEFAILYDFPTRWMNETGAEWEGPGNLYVSRCKKTFAAVKECGVNCDAVGREGDFDQYKVLIVPMLGGIDNALAEKLERFVANGGTLVWNPLSGQRNIETCIFPKRYQETIRKLLGVETMEIATEHEKISVPFTWKKKTYTSSLLFELASVDTAKSVASYDEQWFKGMPAVLENSVGKGNVIFVTGFAEQAFYKDLCDSLIDKLKISRILDTPPSASVEITERTGINNRRIVFLLNGSNSEETVKLDKPMNDLWSGKKGISKIVLEPAGIALLTD